MFMIFKSPFSNDKHDHGIGSKVDLPIPIPCLSLKAAVIIFPEGLSKLVAS